MRARHRAFTLIELLVVIAIISLLMALLLPQLGAAREEGKKVKCLANLRQIGTAFTSYVNDEGEWFPFARSNWYSALYMHGFYYGGHPGRRLPQKPGEWWGYNIAAVRDTPAGRPLNKYLYPDLPDWDVPPGDPLYEAVRKMPVYECPSDTGSFWMDEPTENAISTSLYWMTGSSYLQNYTFARYWAHDFFRVSPAPTPWLHRANAFVRHQFRRWSSMFVILYEDPYNVAEWSRVPRRGWHKKWNRHNFLYLDGHAAHVLTRPTVSTWGPNYKTAGANSKTDTRAWWNDPNDPDYIYRDIAPLPGF